MLKIAKTVLAVSAFAVFATPAVAQDEPEPPRTTYRIEYLSFVDGGANRWDEARTQYVVPARAQAGAPEQQVHWLMAGEWEIMVITEMPDGMADLDTHGSPMGQRINAAITARFANEEAATAARDEIGALVTRSMVTYSHTHP